LASISSVGSADILYEDVMYWMPDGTTLIDPPVPPTNAYVKIQQTVYNDHQGRDVLTGQFAAGAIHGNGGALPAFQMNLYAYAITNLTYGNGPFTGTGSGVQGFVIPDNAGISGIMYGPTAANDFWEVGTGHIGPGYWEWDIDADDDRDNGDGDGILQGQTFNSFMLAVPDGTMHGFIDDAWVHSWHGAGNLEKSSGAGQIDLVYGVVSGPIPEPATLGLLALGGLALLRRRSR
jgi:hypothetical protein